LRRIVQVQRACVYDRTAGRTAQCRARVDRNSARTQREVAGVSVHPGKGQGAGARLGQAARPAHDTLIGAAPIVSTHGENPRSAAGVNIDYDGIVNVSECLGGISQLKSGCHTSVDQRRVAGETICAVQYHSSVPVLKITGPITFAAQGQCAGPRFGELTRASDLPRKGGGWVVGMSIHVNHRARRQGHRAGSRQRINGL